MIEASRRNVLKGVALGVAGVVSGIAIPKANAATEARSRLSGLPLRKATSATRGSTPLVDGTKLNYGGMFDISAMNGHIWRKVNHSQVWTGPRTYDFSSLTTYLDQNPNLNVKVTLQGGGRSSGAWETVYGPLVPVRNSQKGNTANCPRFWTDAYVADFAAFMTALGAAIDGYANLAGVSFSGASLVYDEPWLMGGDTGSGNSLDRLYKAGLTKTTLTNAITSGLAAMVAAFPTTAIEFSIGSAFHYPKSGGGNGGTWTEGRDQLNLLDSEYGAHLVISDHGLGPNEGQSPQPLATASNEYAWMAGRAQAGRPIWFQATLTPGGSGTPTTAEAVAAFTAASQMGACYFEHNGWRSVLSTAQIAQYDAVLKSNVPV